VQDDHAIRQNVKLLFELIADWAAEWAHEGHLVQHLGLRGAVDAASLLQGHRKQSLTKVMRGAAEDRFMWSPTSC